MAAATITKLMTAVSTSPNLTGPRINAWSKFGLPTSSPRTGLMTPATNVGYRYAGAPRGFLFRAGYTPLLFIGGGETHLAHFGGLSFGARL